MGNGFKNAAHTIPFPKNSRTLLSCCFTVTLSIISTSSWLCLWYSLLSKALLHVLRVTAEPSFLVACANCAGFQGTSCWVLLASTGTEISLSFSTVVIVNLGRQGGFGVQTAHLVINVLAVVYWHLHAAVEVLEGRVTHLECFLTDSGRSS